MRTPGPDTITREMTVVLPDEGEYGSAMKALASDRQRAFVIALVRNGGKLIGGGYTRAYAEAGFSGTPETLRVGAHRLASDERVQEAIREEAQRQLGSAAILSTSILVELLNDDNTKKPLKVKIAGMILNRTGLHEKTEHKVSVTKTLNEQEKIDGIIDMAERLGLDPKQLLGSIGIALPEHKSDIPTVKAEVVATSEGLEDVL